MPAQGLVVEKVPLDVDVALLEGALQLLQDVVNSILAVDPLEVCMFEFSFRFALQTCEERQADL